ncbi:unnamed protein product [Schistocephalus solidus]|uniref:ACB domain-containing protein n=1 Tax=Schistocephalus solidus TaxID=70667 RepID=A0A183TQ04_SCHSO|nr:unnamed protein product [Schistocephalus solidus]
MTTFEEAAETVKKLAKEPSQNELLTLYSLYKQATVGDTNTSRPGMLDFKGRSKWDAWNTRKGMDKEAAKLEYIEVAKSAIAKYGLSS